MLQSNRGRTVVSIIAVLLVLNLAVTGYLVFAVSSLDDRTGTLEEESEVLTEYLIHTGEGQENDEGGDLSVERQSGHFVAHDTGQDEGILFEYKYQPVPGDAIYVDASDVNIETTYQESLRDAQAAVSETDYEPMTYGMVISLETPEAWEFIRGESAGLAVAAHLASTDPNYELNESVVLTGQVEPNGQVNSVDHVRSKGEAAGDEGKELIVAPHTQAAVGDPDNIELVQVQTVDEALEYALDPVEDDVDDGDESE